MCQCWWTSPVRRVPFVVWRWVSGNASMPDIWFWYWFVVFSQKVNHFFGGGRLRISEPLLVSKLEVGSWMICTIFIGVDEILQSEAIGLKDPQKSIWNQNHPLMLCRWVKRYWNRNSNGKSGLTCTESTHTLQVGGRHTIAQDAKGPASHVGCNCTAKEWQFWG